MPRAPKPPERRPLGPPPSLDEVTSLAAWLDAELDDAISDLVRLGDEKGDAEYEHEIAFSKANLKAAGKPGSGPKGVSTVDERRAHALLDTEKTFRKTLIAEAKYEAKKAHVRVLESRLSAQQTLARVIHERTHDPVSRQQARQGRR